MRFSLSLVVMVLAGSALAEKKSKVVIDAPPAVAKALKAALAKKYDTVPAAKALSATPLTKEIREACAPSNAIAVVMARSVAGGYSVQVLNAIDGTPLDTFDFKAAAKKPVKALPKPVAAQLLAALKEAQPYVVEKPVEATPPPVPKNIAPKAAEPTPEPVAAVVEPKAAPAEVKDEVSSPAPSSGPQELRTAFRASVGYAGFNRNLDWQNKSEELSGYTAPFAPSVAIGATLYPAAAFTSSFIANIGVTTQANVGVGLMSQPRGDGSRFGTSTVRFRAGALVRIPVSTTFEANAGVGYSSQTFVVAPKSENGVDRPLLPGVAFNGPRANVGVRLEHLGPVSIDANVGFVLAIGKGELAAEGFFPNASAFGLDASAGVSVELVPHIEGRLGFEFARYFISPKTSEADLLQAKSGADQYIGANVSLVFVL